MDDFSMALTRNIMAWISLPLAYAGVRTLRDGLSNKEDGLIDVIYGLALIAVSSLAGGILLLLLL